MKVASKVENPNVIIPKNMTPAEIDAGINLTGYATAPNHKSVINSVYKDSLKYFDKNSDYESMKKGINALINQRLSKKSPITADMIINAAKKYNISPNLLFTSMYVDSSLGTAGAAVRTKNPGNVGNTDDGSLNYQKTWEDGVEICARELARRKFKKANK